MIREYYYLIASLPLLSFGTAALITYVDFLKRCREQLAQSDFALIARATIAPPQTTEDSCGVLQAWKQFDTSLRNELARVRAAQSSKNPAPHIRGQGWRDPFDEQLVRLVMNEGSLLERERLLDRIRWDRLSELQVGHFFDVEFLVIYSLQLQILGRWSRVHQEEGMKTLEELAVKS